MTTQPPPLPRTPYPSDGSDEEWAVIAPSLTLMKEEAPHRASPVRAVCNGRRWLVRTGAEWRMLPHDLPPWPTVSQQPQRWFTAGVCEAIVHDRRLLLRAMEGRPPHPRAAVFASRTVPARPERGGRAGDDGAKRRTGSTVHQAVARLGHLLARLVTPATEQDRAQVAAVAEQVQAVTGASVAVAVVDQGDPGEQPAADAALHRRRLEVVTLPEATRGVGRLPRRWVAERSTAGMARFRRLARDDERLPQTLAGRHVLAVAIIMLTRFVTRMAESS
jgi:transposase